MMTTTQQAITSILFRITFELFGRASVREALDIQGFTSRVELSIVESVFTGMLSSIHDAGVAPLSVEWLHEINKRAGASAIFAENKDNAQYYSGNPAAYVVAWDQIAYWSDKQLERAAAA